MTLDEIWSWCQRKLGARNDCWRLPILATHGGDARTVVARDYSWPYLTIYSDSRANKVKQIAEDSKVTAVYYDSTERIQIRLHGRADVEMEGPDVEAIYNQLPPASRGDYLSKQAPGTELNDSTEIADKPHFCIVKIKVHRLDYLALRREGHRRASFLGQDTAKWLVP